jgi:hypothetical protein
MDKKLVTGPPPAAPFEPMGNKRVDDVVQGLRNRRGVARRCLASGRGWMPPFLPWSSGLRPATAR